MNNKTLRMRLKASVLAMALATLPLGANAAGLGRISVLSVLGQPLRAELDITANNEELSSISARVASAEAFKQAGIEFTSMLPGIRFSVEKRANGQPFLAMRSDQPFSEPFLDILVEMNWASGRMVREYTFLLDPPESKQKSAAQAQAAPVTLPTIAAPEVRKDVPITPATTATPPPSTTTTTSTPPAPKPGDEMKVVRGTDGVQRIVKATPTNGKISHNQATHTVKRGETLHRIAGETRPDGVSLDQMLVALFRSNKDAFEGDNINRLRAGKILAIPDRDAVAAIDAAEAKQIILAQSADFNAYRKKLASATANSTEQHEEAPKQAASGKIAPLVKDQTPPPAQGKDKLEISKSEAVKDKGGANKTDAAGRSAAGIEEELLSRDNAIKEANARIAELDKNLKDLKSLVELKNQGMADLQKQAQPPQEPAVAVVPPETPVEKAIEKPAEPPKPIPEVKKPEPPAQTPEPPAPEPSFIDEYAELIFGGGGILALLLGYLGYAKWRKKRQEAEFDAMGPLSQVETTSVNSEFGSTGGQVVDTGSTSDNSLQTDFSLAGGSPTASEGVDPIAEADVYMAYGRNAQAEEILLDALKTDPERQEIHLKLLEIYAASKSLKQFETIAVDLHQLTNATGPAWGKAIRLGKQIDPQNELYRDNPAPQAVEAAFDPAATMMLTPQDLGKEHEEEAENEMMQTAIIPPEPAVQEDKEILPESLDFDLDLSSDTSAPAAETPAESLADQSSASSASGSGVSEADFDFDLGEPAPAETSADAGEAASASAAAGDIDFDFDLGDSGESKDATPVVLAEPEQESVSAPEFDLDLSAPEPSQPADQPDEFKLPEADSSSSSAKDDAGLDFDFDLDSDLPAAGSAEPTAPPPGQPVGGVDLSSISLDLDDVKPAEAAPSPAPALDEAASQEVTTKLELALAYEEMGDKDGARELLQEVLNEGNTEQQAMARDKLAQLG